MFARPKINDDLFLCVGTIYEADEILRAFAAAKTQIIRFSLAARIRHKINPSQSYKKTTSCTTLNNAR